MCALTALAAVKIHVLHSMIMMLRTFSGAVGKPLNWWRGRSGDGKDRSLNFLSKVPVFFFLCGIVLGVGRPLWGEDRHCPGLDADSPSFLLRNHHRTWLMLCWGMLSHNVVKKGQNVRQRRRGKKQETALQNLRSSPTDTQVRFHCCHSK